MPDIRKISVTVNGKRHEAEVESRLLLADFLRNTGNYDRVEIQSMRDREGVQSNRF